MKKLFSLVVLCSIFSILFFATAFGQIPATINGAGTWSASTGSGSVTFAAGQCYTVTVEAWGAGGGGGGASGDGASGGGTGGGFAQGAVTISGGSICFYSVGTGGTAGTTAGTNGGPGGPTWFNGTPGTNNNTTGNFINGGGGDGGNGVATNVGAAAQTTVGAGTFGTPGVTDTASHSGGTGGGGFVSGNGDGGGGGGGGGAGTGGNGGNGATTIVGGTGAFGCPNGGGGGGGGGGGATGAGVNGNPGNNNGGGGTGGAANGGGAGGTANGTAAGLGGTGTAGGAGSALGGGGGAGNGCCGCSGGGGGDGAAGSGSIGGGGGGGTGDGGGGNGGNGGAHGGGGAGADGSSSAAGGTGGSGYITITVALAPPPTATAGPTLAAICQGATTTIMNGSVSVGATGVWSGGAGTWTNPTDPVNATYTAGAAETGTITLTLTATSACGTSSTTKTLTINPSPSAPTVTSPVTYCQNAAPAVLTATGTGSLLWYTVATGGTGSGTAPTPLTTTAGQTTYYVSQTANGCESGRDSIVVIVNALPAASANNTGPYCTNGTITLTASGGGSYSWSGPNGYSGTGASPAPFSAATYGSGTYTVTVTGVNTCTATASTNVVVSTTPTSTFTVTTPVCTGQNSTITYTGNATGAATYTWGFAGGTVASGAGQGPYTVNWATAGNENVTLSVTEGGCSSTTTTVPVTVNAVPTSTFTVTTPVCTGQNSAIAYTGNASGAATYTWNFAGGTTVSGTGQGPYQVNWPTAGTENVTLSVTQNGCSSILTTVPVTVNATPTSLFTVTSPVCTGQNSTITYTGTGTGAGTYTWGFAGGTVVSGTGQGPYQVNWATAGTENVTLSVTENGCNSTTTTVPVTVNQVPTSTFTAITPVCAFQNSGIVYTGNASAGATYTWNFAGGTVAAGTGQGPYAVNWSTAGTENVTLSVTQNGCSSTLTTVPVTVNPTSTATFTVTSPVCTGQNSTITYTGTGTGAGAYTWGFAGGTVVSGNGQGPYTVNWTTAGTENVTLSVTENGCSDTSSENVVVNAIPTSLFTVSSPVCTGQNSTITYTGNATGAASYTWSFGGGTIASGNGQGPYEVNWATAGAENVTLSVTENGCNSTLTTVPVTVNTTPVSNAGPDVSFCSGGSATIGVAAVGGNTYAWLPVTGLSSASSSNPTVTLTNNTNSDIATNYIVSTSANNCTSTDTAVVTVFPALVLSAPVIKENSCYGTSNGCITVVASGGTPNYLYVWSTGANGTQVCNLPIGIYNLTVVDANGCTDSLNNIAVTQPDSLTLSTVVTQVSCPDQSDGNIMAALTGGTQPYTYNWSNGGGNINPDVSLPVGFYTLTVNDVNGCTISTGDSVTSLPALGLTYSIQNVLCIPLTDGAISITVASNFPPISYMWSNGANTQNIAGIGAGTYSVTVTDGHNCSADTTLNVTTASIYAITALPHDTSINLGGQVPISIATNGVGGNVANISWEPPSELSCTDCISPVASPGQSINYYVTITSDSGCVGVDTVNIEVIPIHDIYVPNAFTPNGSGNNNVLQVFGNKEAWKFFHMSIFDRWGEKVYETHDMDFSWDGTYRGKSLPMAVYVYEIRIVYLDNYTDKSYHGSITLVR